MTQGHETVLFSCNSNQIVFQKERSEREKQQVKRLCSGLCCLNLVKGNLRRFCTKLSIKLRRSEKAMSACQCASVAGTSLSPEGNINTTTDVLQIVGGVVNTCPAVLWPWPLLK